MNENIQPQQQNNQPETRSRKFWRVVLGSMVGFVLANIIVGILGLLMFLGMIASLEKMGSSSSSTSVKDNSVLVMDLSASIEERATDIPFNFGPYKYENLGLVSRSVGFREEGAGKSLRCCRVVNGEQPPGFILEGFCGLEGVEIRV